MAHTAQAQLATATALNRAARFRALSQRSAKAYCQLALDVLPDNARDIQGAVQRLIQLGFEDLGKAGFAGDTVKMIAAVQQEAAALAALVARPASREATPAVSAQADKMLAAANRLTESIEGSAKLPAARLINISGRQRMLSQRMAKNFFLMAAGADARNLREQLAGDRIEFKQALTALAAAPVSTSAIRNDLQLAEAQWLFFDSALAGHRAEPDALRNVATTSERLLEVSNSLTQHYEVALKDLLGTV